MHPLRKTVWCGFWAGKVIGHFVFETDEGTAVTVNEERYRNLVSTQLWPKLEGRNWPKFSERVISLHGAIRNGHQDLAILSPVISSCGGL